MPNDLRTKVWGPRRPPEHEAILFNGKRRGDRLLDQTQPGEIQPGRDVYVAVLDDAFGRTYKIGSGHSTGDITTLNRYRRPSQGEPLWRLLGGCLTTCASADEAQDIEYRILKTAKSVGYGSNDHSKCLVDIPEPRLRALFHAACGDIRPFSHQGAARAR